MQTDGDRRMKKIEPSSPARPAPQPLKYDCSKCPAYCCSYDRIIVNGHDVNRLSRHLGVPPEEVVKRHTRTVEGERVLRHQKDAIYGTVCGFLDKKTRRCGVYEGRPGVCREYPDTNRCGYYDFLSWERRHQDDPDFIPLQKV